MLNSIQKGDVLYRLNPANKFTNKHPNCKNTIGDNINNLSYSWMPRFILISDVIKTTYGVIIRYDVIDYNHDIVEDQKDVIEVYFKDEVIADEYDYKEDIKTFKYFNESFVKVPIDMPLIEFSYDDCINEYEIEGLKVNIKPYSNAFLAEVNRIGDDKVYAVIGNTRNETISSAINLLSNIKQEEQSQDTDEENPKSHHSNFDEFFNPIDLLLIASILLS